MAKKENKQNKHFFKDFKAELKKVVWPTPKQLLNSTSAVIAIVLISAIMVFVLDIVFEFVNKEVVTNLQGVVNEKFNTEEQNTENESTEGDNEATDGEESNTTESTEQENATTSTDENAETSENDEQTNTDQQ